MIDHILSGRWLNLLSFLPKKLPKLKNANWKTAIKNGNRKEFTPMMLPPIPIQKLSSESAMPRKIASLASIEFEESKSEEIGFFIIFIVIPKKFIKKLYIFSSPMSKLLLLLLGQALEMLFSFLKV